jgi:chitinase
VRFCREASSSPAYLAPAPSLVAKTGTLTFKPGETRKTITIEVIGNNKKEPDKTFYLDLFGNSSNSLFTKGRGIGTILNDD